MEGQEAGRQKYGGGGEVGGGGGKFKGGRRRKGGKRDYSRIPIYQTLDFSNWLITQTKSCFPLNCITVILHLEFTIVQTNWPLQKLREG